MRNSENFRDLFYGRQVEARVYETKDIPRYSSYFYPFCIVCDEDSQLLLSVDTSNGEYGDMNICKKCIDLMFEKRVNICELREIVDNNKKIDKIRKVLAVKKIWRFWKKSISDPNYELCKKRLLDEYNDLINI